MPTLEEFLNKIAPQYKDTPRYRRLDRLDQYRTAVQYKSQDRPYDVRGYFKANPMMPGSMTASPSWDKRDPGAVYNINFLATRTLTEWALGGSGWCLITVPNDKASETWIQAVAEEYNLQAAMIEARNMVGAIGTVAIAVSVYRGKLVIDVINGKDIWPLSFDPYTKEIYQAVKLYETLDQFGVSKEPVLWARCWDSVSEVYYRRVKNNFGSYEWEEVSRSDHKLGFCPILWYAPGAKEGDFDGVPDAPEGALDLVDEINYTYGGATATTLRNADDTLVVHEDPRINPGQIRTGGFNYIQASGGASYLSQDGSSARICMEVGDKRAAQYNNMIGVVLLSPEEKARAASAELLRRIYQPMLVRVDTIQDLFGRHVIVPLCRMLHAINQQKRIDLPKIVKHDPALGVDIVVDNVPGKSMDVVLQWPDPLPPTDQDRLVAVQTVSAALDKGLMSRETAMKYLQSRGIPYADIASEIVQIDKERSASAKLQAVSLGLAESSVYEQELEDEEQEQEQANSS